MTINVVLKNHFESFVRDQAQSGRYNNVSEVVLAGLRLLEDLEWQMGVQLQALRADLHEGKMSGHAQDAEFVLDRLKSKYAKKTKAKLK
jgi:antitoxin ParD1/3/4